MIDRVIITLCSKQEDFMRITDHVYLLSGDSYGAGDYGMLGNVYGIRTTQGLILIDCGLPDTGLKMIRETLDYYEIEDTITHVLITHSHVDHCGNAKTLQDCGASIIAGEGDINHLCKPGGVNLFRDIRYEEGSYHFFPAFTPDIAISKDNKMEINGLTFRFILIPGHTPGSIAVWLDIDGKSMLFTGDSVNPLGIRIQEVDIGWYGDPRFDKKSLVESLMKLIPLDPDMILGGHGAVCLRDGNHVLRRAAKRAYFELR
jgi:glyoxylase-like metal-dependent hydrolase (beta-lactamase superfamily II)